MYTPGLYTYYYERGDESIQKVKNMIDDEKYHFLIDGVIKNPNYSSTQIVSKKGEEDYDFLNNKSFKSIVNIRRRELQLTTVAISFLAKHKNSPALRLPNGVNHFLNKFKSIEDKSIKQGIYSNEFQVKIKAINTLMKRRIGKKIIDYICDNFNSVSLVCDTPLDWVRFGNLPLMLTHEISRINSTPGNVLLKDSSLYPKVEIKASQLSKILVLRSFRPDDEIKYCLELSIDKIEKLSACIDVEIIDINNEYELIDAINDFSGKILVMDCHGHHGGVKQNGWLEIGDDKVDVWHLSKKIKMPPIVILSACLTSAISGSHASVANGFLTCGAISVLGTLLPVNAIHSAFFVAMLLHRIAEFPRVLSLDYTHITLRLLISLFFRMSYTSDVLRAFQIAGMIDKVDFEDINRKVCNEINELSNNWNEVLIDEIIIKSSYGKKFIRDFIDQKCYFTETMSYSQIGFPECIHIDVKN